jgi:hypothetical protein
VSLDFGRFSKNKSGKMIGLDVWGGVSHLFAALLLFGLPPPPSLLTPRSSLLAHRSRNSNKQQQQATHEATSNAQKRCIILYLELRDAS